MTLTIVNGSPVEITYAWQQGPVLTDAASTRFVAPCTLDRLGLQAASTTIVRVTSATDQATETIDAPASGSTRYSTFVVSPSGSIAVTGEPWPPERAVCPPS